jgi:hypothetical protein
MDSMIRGLMILFPYDLPDKAKSPYGWDAFARKIRPSLIRDPADSDNVVL